MINFILMSICSILFNFNGFASDLNQVEMQLSENFQILQESNELHFPINLEKLKKGHVQYGLSVTQSMSFKDQNFLQLDRHQLKKKDADALFIVSKTAYLLDNKTPAYFNSALFNSPHYIEKTFTHTTAKASGTPNLVKISRTINVGPFNIGVINFDLFVEELNQEEDQEFIQTMNNFDSEWGNPEVISALYMTNANKMLNGTYVINKYYSVKDQGTLVISYQFSSVKKIPAVPFFIIRNQTLKSAVNETHLYVKSIRKYPR